MVSMGTSVDQPRTDQPIAEAIGDLLRKHQGLPMGRISFSAFAEEVGGWDVSTLRRMVSGKITLQPEAVEAMASRLGVPPDYFMEYRAWQVREGLKRHPEIADIVYDDLIIEIRARDERKGLVAPRPK